MDGWIDVYPYIYIPVAVYAHLCTVHYCYNLGLFSTTGSVYVSEISPSHLRGKLGVVVNSFTAGGQLTGVVIAGLFSVDSNFAYAHGWRFGCSINENIYSILRVNQTTMLWCDMNA